MSSSGGLSREEFLILQQQLIALRNRNYELQEALQKKNQEISQLSSPRSEALQFANKLINRRDGGKEKEIAQKYEAELDALRMKLTSQEEEFRLQQETLIAELNKIVSQNEALNNELEHFKADGSIYSSPQAGTPCEPPPSIVENSEYASVGSRELPTEASTSSSSSVGIQCSGSETPLSDAGKDASLCELIYESKSCQADEGVNVPDLENQLLEYKEMVAELRSSLEDLSSKNAKSLSDVQEREDKIVSLMEELKVANDNIAKKNNIISHAISSISKVTDSIGQERVPLPEQCTEEQLLEKEIHLILNFISENQAAIAKVTDEKTAVEKQLSEAQAKVDALAARITQMEEAHKAERARADEDIHSLSAKLLELQKAHDSKVEAMERESANNCDELKAKIAALENSGSKFCEDTVAMLETRYQLELADREKTFESEKKELQRKVCSLEASLVAKDEEKALALKKQVALVKELQRAVREEKKRAESMEKLGRCSSEERGWHLIGETESKNAQTLDGLDSRSVSSASALESDNFELISRLTSLQRTHAETLDRINALEAENARLNCEINEKSELIEHWIRRRPLAQGTAVSTPSKTEGTFRKLLLSTLPTDEATNDIKEMNKKLQRMLEETLSKNIILQRDLQTLLERTEM
ncbi:hypothetical protein V3C99_008755 [Haemonchus contortus]